MRHKYIKHINPAWKEKLNFTIEANIDPDISQTQIGHEQLFCRQISDYIFEVCCIPFFIYNISLGDEVKTDSNYSVIEVTKKSGHFTFRVWFGDSKSTTIRDDVIEKAKELLCPFEWYSCNLMAIDAPTDGFAKKISNYLQEKEDSGLLTYETGRI